MFRNSEDTVPDANEGEVECMTWLYNGTILAVGGRDAAIKLYDVGRKWRLSLRVT